jgi:trehalose 6-phosphate phosphatase
MEVASNLRTYRRNPGAIAPTPRLPRDTMPSRPALPGFASRAGLRFNPGLRAGRGALSTAFPGSDGRPDPLTDTAYALFLDFDGTLVEIAPRPDGVVVPPALPSGLARLRTRLGGALALVTGRPIATIDGFLAPERFDVAGLHGVEQRRDGRVVGGDPAAHPALRAGVATLQRETADLDGVLIEDKGCSVAVHWRLANDTDAARAQEVVATVAEPLGAAYRLQQGKAVAEILPASATKGHAIRAFLREAPYAGRRAIFIGDDLTDEKAFVPVNADGGITVRVGPGETVARHRVADPAAVRALLMGWAEGGAIDPGSLPPA